MGVLGNPRESLGCPGWEYMGILGDPWESLGTPLLGNPWAVQVGQPRAAGGAYHRPIDDLRRMFVGDEYKII